IPRPLGNNELNGCRSTSRQSIPKRRRPMAVLSPTGPPPTMSAGTLKSFMVTRPLGSRGLHVVVNHLWTLPEESYGRQGIGSADWALFPSAFGWRSTSTHSCPAIGPYERRQLRPVKPSPGRALRHAVSEPHRRKRRLDHVAGPQMFPVLCRKVE